MVLLAAVLHSAHVAAFGAGNIGQHVATNPRSPLTGTASISAVEGQNWRHGDIEDTLLHLLLAQVAGGRQFSKLDVRRVYFGNWLRDYSQAIDVGAAKHVSAEAVRLVLWVLGFLSFGLGTGPFEVTRDRLGCYRPEEHIDNPRDYADNVDARRYDSRLRGPVDERRELGIDRRTGLKHYIATEDIGITTSAALVRDLYGQCIQLGRRYGRAKDEADLFEALRLLGTANHCLEDYAAHSNYVELALREMGELGVFPLVGRNTGIQLPGARDPVYPVVTGTFGGVDFLQSLVGEFEDRATQSELQELEGVVRSSQTSGDFGLLHDLLGKIPPEIFGGKDHAEKASELKAKAQQAPTRNMDITPRQPEELTRWLDSVGQQIHPILEWHDEIMLSLTETIEEIPVLPQLVEQLTKELKILVFSLLAPVVLPIIQQIKEELATAAAEIVQISQAGQLNVFHDDAATDPTHSMLAKDHFSHVLNEPAGQVSAQVLRWVVPQIMACWDDPRIDAGRTLARIVHGVLHHPAQRDHGADGAADGRRGMYAAVEQWWAAQDEAAKDEMRARLSRDGVLNGRNHRDGVDSGRGYREPVAAPARNPAADSGIRRGGSEDLADDSAPSGLVGGHGPRHRAGALRRLRSWMQVRRASLRGRRPWRMHGQQSDTGSAHLLPRPWRFWRG